MTTQKELDKEYMKGFLECKKLDLLERLDELYQQRIDMVNTRIINLAFLIAVFVLGISIGRFI